MRLWTSSIVGCFVISTGFVWGVDSVKAPRPVPLTRPEMKEYLEDMKTRKPRIPLPELTEEEKARAAAGGRGGMGGGYEGRIRALYMPAGDGRGGGNTLIFSGSPAGGGGGRTGGGPGGPGGGAGGRGGAGGGGSFGQNGDPAMTLDYAFKTQLFWIVSRTNNCQYCLGHQESKLLGAGMTEDEIASLDSDWSQFSPKQQAAFAFARKFTFEPHLLNDADIDKLRPHFTDMQILEMILSMAGNNSINRWKEGAGVPQSQNGGGFGRRPGAAGAGGDAVAKAAPAEDHGYLTPTAEKFQKVLSKVAPIVIDEKTGQPTHSTVCNRPELESRAEVEKQLAAAQERKSRLPLVEDAKARAVIADDSMRLWIDSSKLTARGVTMEDVVAALRDQRLNVSPAQADATTKDAAKDGPVLLNVSGRQVSVEELGKLVIKKSDAGQEIAVQDIAKVEVGVRTEDKTPLTNWIRLLANFPRGGKQSINSNRNADEKGDLSPLMKAQVSWIIARQDRAWYATGEAKRRLQALGQTDDQIYKLDGSWSEFTPAEQSLFTVAKKLAATPVVLTDSDVDEALKQTGPREVVQMISYTTGRASFDRITEAAGLPVEK